MAFIRENREVLDDFGFISVVRDSVVEDASETFFERICIAHIGAVAVVPILEDGNIVLIKQYRSSINDLSLEAVAGRRDVSGEDLIDCAKRELIEEIAVAADEVIELGWIHTSPGFTDEKIFMFLAKNAKFIENNIPDGVEEELAERIVVSLEQAIEWTYDGTIRDGKTIVNLHLAKKYLAQSL
ncbi:MAG: NUDIX hydrolase [Acidimicrobiia bacterium]